MVRSVETLDKSRRRMKPFFSTLLCCVLFLAANAQDTLVTIKPSTARYYLEIEDEVFVLREKDSLSIILIDNLEEQIKTKNKIIRTYEMDAGLYSEYIDNLLLENTLILETNERLERKLRLRKYLEILGGIGIVVISIL